LQIDNGKAAHSQTHAGVDVKTIIVWAPMPNGAAHSTKQRFIYALTLIPDYSYDATHE
jgi:hypothetical protein